VTRHRLLNDGVSPIPMGATAEYACVCGRRGTRADIEHHVAQAVEERSRENDTDVTIGGGGDDFGGDTKAHYLPVTPRRPARASAPPTFTDAPSAPELPPPPRSHVCPLCEVGTPLADLPEIAAWSCGHWIRKTPRPIAEAFQDMLRSAYQAGVLSATSGEPFESWYQREVLQ
jgi:hypothetical protein